jgi:hypothetical protein
MSEDETKILENSPLLRRVLESQERVEAHIKTLEANIERQGFNTKPMWEKALEELADMKQSLATLSRKIDVFSGDMLNLRAEQLKNEERLRRLEAENEGGGMTTVN